MDMYSYRTNVNRTQDPDTRTANGDFPEVIRTLPVRPDTLEAENMPEGSLSEGISMAQDLYKPPVVEGDPLEATRMS